MKNRRLKVFVIGFFCISCCSWTSVAGDDSQKALGLLKAKLLNLADELDDLPFFDHPEIAANDLGLSFRNGTPKDIIGSFDGKTITGKIYDVDTGVWQNGKFNYSATWKSAGGKEYTGKCGCGLHAMKNLIFMTKLLLEKNEKKRQEIKKAMNSHKVFLHYFEGVKQSGDDGGSSNWVSIWKRGKTSAGVCPLFDTPPARLQDAINLREAIFKGDVFAPAGSKKILKHAIIFGDIYTQKHGVIEYEKKYIGDNDTYFWNKGKAELKELWRTKKRFVIPVHVYYSHSNNDGRHWIAIVLRKLNENILEIFFVESGEKGYSYFDSHIKLPQYIFNSLCS